MTKISFRCLLVGVSLVYCMNQLAQAATPQEQMPWTLRDHYTFGGTLLNLDYAKDNAEWRVIRYQEDSETSRMNPDVLVRDVGFAIELADGRFITYDMLGSGGETIFGRTPAASDIFGEGTIFSVQFVPYEGLYVEHKIWRFKKWNFLIITIDITNKSEKPVSVVRIQPAIFKSGSLSGLGDIAQVYTGNFIFRGGFPVYTHDGDAETLFIHDTERNINLGLGVFPGKIASSIIHIQSAGGDWQGRMETSFSPGTVLLPGASLSSDPIWFCMDTPPVVSNAQFAWLLQSYCRTDSTEYSPRAWVTVPDTEGLSALRREAEAARSFGISHALIPDNWEGRPGSYEGGAPQYPRHIGDAAKSLRDAGVSPGITIDPLLGSGNSSDWMAKSVDGQNWVNLSADEGRKFAVKHIRKLVDDGFSFIVIAESHIPDEILATFNLTRAQSDLLAFDVVAEAIASAPVALLPASKAKIHLRRDDWLGAAGAVSRVAEFGIGTAAVRMEFDKESAIDDETLLAVSFWRGPIEFVGSPPRSVQSELSRILGAKPLVVRPQDTYRKSPLTWLLRASSSATGYIGSSILSFTGAAPWKVAGVEAFGGEELPTILWRPENEKPILIPSGVIDAAKQFSTHGILLNSTHPVFAGTDETLTLGLDRLKSITWDEAQGILTGVLGAGNGSSHAYFFCAKNQVLKTARMASQQVRPQIEGQWISIPLAASGGAFELKFEAR